MDKIYAILEYFLKIVVSNMLLFENGKKSKTEIILAVVSYSPFAFVTRKKFLKIRLHATFPFSTTFLCSFILIF